MKLIPEKYTKPARSLGVVVSELVKMNPEVAALYIDDTGVQGRSGLTNMGIYLCPYCTHLQPLDYVDCQQCGERRVVVQEKAEPVKKSNAPKRPQIFAGDDIWAKSLYRIYQKEQMVADIMGITRPQARQLIHAKDKKA